MGTRVTRAQIGEPRKASPRGFRSALAAIGLTLSASALADTVVDWGTVSTPLATEATFSFAQYDLVGNFTDAYHFTLEGGAGASYSVTFSMDACRNGCGNPELSYGIYDNNGGLIGSSGNVVTLSAGNYVFQVKGTGMGTGNSVDYWGSVTFAAASVAMVSPAPEPATWLLTLAGLGGLGGLAWQRRGARRQPEPPTGDPA